MRFVPTLVLLALPSLAIAAIDVTITKACIKFAGSSLPVLDVSYSCVIGKDIKKLELLNARGDEDEEEEIVDVNCDGNRHDLAPIEFDSASTLDYKQEISLIARFLNYDDVPIDGESVELNPTIEPC
ncbi:hypothetical protein DFQ27_007915 [Actinomortierella ambigua]|uniref:Uncharacterized protein n=1 Tax=Actinomortierella ambigua TaxID=1343610 RepID=A0A9P6QKY2_9FUNG|nr:hypothetical protein DFQ27_007915 [Actinomortierella ambigua]